MDALRCGSRRLGSCEPGWRSACRMGLLRRVRPVRSRGPNKRPRYKENGKRKAVHMGRKAGAAGEKAGSTERRRSLRDGRAVLAAEANIGNRSVRKGERGQVGACALRCDGHMRKAEEQHCERIKRRCPHAPPPRPQPRPHARFFRRTAIWDRSAAFTRAQKAREVRPPTAHLRATGKPRSGCYTMIEIREA